MDALKMSLKMCLLWAGATFSIYCLNLNGRKKVLKQKDKVSNLISSFNWALIMTCIKPNLTCISQYHDYSVLEINS